MTISGWEPPQNFIPVPSAVEGITVYGPPPVEEKVPEAVTFKCPQCGATTRFDVAAGGVACEHCGFTAEVKARQVGTEAKESEFTLDTLREAENGWGVERRVLHCDSCGAELSLAANALTSTCSFCASNRVQVRTDTSSSQRPRYLIPFKIRPEETRKLAAAWLGQGWFHPDQLAANAIVDHFTGLYMPFWTFSARIESTWKAEVGYEREERYYDSSDKEWKTRTVIDWRWESGHRTTEIANMLKCGSTHASHLILDRLQPFDLNALTDYKPDFLAGWQAHSYNISLPDAWEKAKTTMRDEAKEDCTNGISSSHVRNFSMNADFADEVWRYVLLPVYLAAYRFEDKAYQVMVNGQTGEVAGQKPVAWWKIWVVVAILMIPGLCLGLIGLPMLAAGGAGVIPLGLGVLLLIAGLIVAFILYNKAVESEAS